MVVRQQILAAIKIEKWKPGFGYNAIGLGYGGGTVNIIEPGKDSAWPFI